MQTITIPESIEQAVSDLNGLAALLTAKKWARAAIVWAFTEPGTGGPRTVRKSAQFLTIREFADLKITGLTHGEDVGFYRKCWQSAIDDGQATAVKPGEKVKLPALDWPPFPRTRTEQERVETVIRNNPEIVAEAIQAADPFQKVERALHEVRRTEPDITRPMVEQDYGKAFRSGFDRMLPALYAMRDDQWEPDAIERTLGAFLVRILTELMAGQTQSTIFDEIEEFLAVKP
jgi:hypothetical protein